MRATVGARHRSRAVTTGCIMTRLLTLLLAIAAFVGCGKRPEKILGQRPEVSPVGIASACAAEAPAMLAVRGTMIKKCPVAGCWFILRDASGTIKVDTKTAGFVVLDVPLGTPMVVAGRIAVNGLEKTIEATGLSY